MFSVAEKAQQDPHWPRRALVITKRNFRKRKTLVVGSVRVTAVWVVSLTLVLDLGYLALASPVEGSGGSDVGRGDVLSLLFRGGLDARVEIALSELFGRQV